jgi:TetR/AcrR family transcriptional regulator
MHAIPKHRLGTRGRPLQSRAAILRAAVREFSEQGLSGARTEAIARSAKVNKALLYYYFGDKDTLYGTVLDEVFGGLLSTIKSAVAQKLPPGEKILAYVGAHFDYIASHPLYPRIVQNEMMQARRGNSPHFERIVRSYFQPVFMKVADVLEEGMSSGEFRRVDPQHFVPSMIAVIAFYFNSTHVTRLVTGEDPLSPERLSVRRAAVLDFISAALFRPDHLPHKGPKGARA